MGDFVRINKTKRTFDKGYLPNWTQELFQILAVVKTQTPITYKIKDLEGELVKVSKVAKIRNRCNQVPHLTQDTNGKVTN